MKVTKEDVDKAKAEWDEAEDAACVAAAEDDAYVANADAAFDKYVKLKREYGNE